MTATTTEPRASNVPDEVAFAASAAVFLGLVEHLALSSVWGLSQLELTPTAIEVLDALKSRAVPGSPFRSAVWRGQALVEFQDLQPAVLPRRGAFMKVNYAFFEALATLRSSVAAALNGQFHAALSTLRPAFELFVFHHWWMRRNQRVDSYDEFYRWLYGKDRATNFTEVLNEVYANVEFPTEAAGHDDARALWRSLCAYVHKPNIHETVTRLRPRVEDSFNTAALSYYFELLNEVQRVCLDLCIAFLPHALLPVPVHRKFGFSPPVGALFDESNFVVLREALGESLLASYSAFYEERQPQRDVVDWARARRDLTDEEIIASWSDPERFNDDSEPFQQRFLVRWACMKAKLRGTRLVLTYSDADATLVDYVSLLESP